MARELNIKERIEVLKDSLGPNPYTLTVDKVISKIINLNIKTVTKEKKHTCNSLYTVDAVFKSTVIDFNSFRNYIYVLGIVSGHKNPVFLGHSLYTTIGNCQLDKEQLVYGHQSVAQLLLGKEFKDPVHYSAYIDPVWSSVSKAINSNCVLGFNTRFKLLKLTDKGWV